MSGHETLRDDFSQAFEWMRDLGGFVSRMGPDKLAIRDELKSSFGIKADYGDDDPGVKRFLVACRQYTNGIKDHREAKKRIIDMVVGSILAAEGGEPKAAPAPAHLTPVTAQPSLAPETPAAMVPAPQPMVEEPKKPTDRPARFEPVNPFMTLPLAAPAKAPVSLPGRFFELLLPAPGADATPRTLMAWAGGNLWSEDQLVLCFEDLSEDGLERMVEAENEIFSSAKTVFGRPAMFPKQNSEDNTLRGFEFLDVASRNAGIYTITAGDACSAFRDTLRDVMSVHFRSKLDALVPLGASLRFGENLAMGLAGAWDLEQFYLRETGNIITGRAQDIRGSISSDCDMVPGLVYRRAAFRHLTTGTTLPVALQESVVELRFAQAQHGADPEDFSRISRVFDKVFFNDCVEPLESYKIANNEMEPSF